MSNAPLSDEKARAAIEALHRYGGISAAADALGINRLTLSHHVKVARARGFDGTANDPAPPVQPAQPSDVPRDRLRALLKHPVSIADLADRLDVSPARARQTLERARAEGLALQERDGLWQIETVPQLGRDAFEMRELVADERGWIRVGAIGDTHMGSKHARLDCMEDWFNYAHEQGVKTVLHAGNWIDGEARFNKHELTVHGMDAQCRHLAEHYPRRAGMETWAIAGDDHEGWYAQREGVDIGRYAEMRMRDAGRTDWHDLGYMEACIKLVHPATGASSTLCLMHPGGGSAYAISYKPQKIIEAFDGGEKPAVLFIGHYHKADYLFYRNVHAVQVGTFEDQTTFMRKKGLSAAVGGGVFDMHIDPRTGAIDHFKTDFKNYFVRSYYNGRWSLSGDVRHAPRGA